MAGGDFFSGFDAFTLTISLPVPPAPDVIGAAAGPPPSAAARSLLSARREAAATRVGVSWRSTARLVPAHHACLCVCVREVVLGRPRCLHPCVVTPGGGFPISQRAPRGRCSGVCYAGLRSRACPFLFSCPLIWQVRGSHPGPWGHLGGRGGAAWVGCLRGGVVQG